MEGQVKLMTKADKLFREHVRKIPSIVKTRSGRKSRSAHGIRYSRASQKRKNMPVSPSRRIHPFIPNEGGTLSSEYPSGGKGVHRNTVSTRNSSDKPHPPKSTFTAVTSISEFPATNMSDRYVGASCKSQYANDQV